jgi:hypothetical protein
MRKQLLLACALSSIFTFSAANAIETNTTPVPHKNSAMGRIMRSDNNRHLSFSDFGKEYSNFKDYLQKRYGLSYSLTTSFTPQYGSPSGKEAGFQTIVYPAITWEMLNNRYGQMTLNAAYNAVRYSGADGQKIQNNINVVTPINDYTTQSNEFPELFITYQLPGKYDWMTIGLGQYPIYNFDGTTYDSNQQENFINWTFSQNASSTYPTAGLGSYLQINPTKEWSFAAGFQQREHHKGIVTRKLFACFLNLHQRGIYLAIQFGDGLHGGLLDGFFDIHCVGSFRLLSCKCSDFLRDFVSLHSYLYIL